ncbi:LysR substrate-binding domain-containing protein [Paralcaligenes ureilyticus]|uniref:DNA-binding transcriptional LysR family regulator n=1 Tax=Paralcaligenes ureilyticus TaxID=627131 RepID=A0A4R3MB63_9BURK|nr:LysR substrate-binding domain-containing protein [Paralcaligenes ureilyticus]TCT08675.1 DNA-binding transcriptional LysR family regulator [Paralcaligenes ureilyticus]
MARSLNFQQIEAFKAVIQTGTTTRAALMLNTTQPSISRRIAELQNASELKLFELHQGRLRPTSEGKLLYKTIQKHFDGLEKIESVVSILRKSGTGALRIACTPTLGSGLMPPVVRQFLQKFPNTYVNIQTLGTPQLAEYLHQDLCDVALTTGTLDQKDFQPQVIKTSSAVCVLPLDHPLKNVDVIDLKLLKDDRVLSLSDNEEITMQIKALLTEGKDSNDFVIETTSSITICALVAAGNGIAIVNPYVAHTFAGQLLIKKLAPAINIPVQMAMPIHTAPSLLTRHFIEILLAHVETL